jgi:hypothetical protein
MDKVQIKEVTLVNYVPSPQYYIFEFIIVYIIVHCCFEDEDASTENSFANFTLADNKDICSRDMEAVSCLCEVKSVMCKLFFSIDLSALQKCIFT